MKRFNKKNGLYGQVQEVAEGVAGLKRTQSTLQEEVDELYEQNDYPAVKNVGKQSFTMIKDGDSFYFVDKDKKRYKISVSAE